MFILSHRILLKSNRDLPPIIRLNRIFLDSYLEKNGKSLKNAAWIILPIDHNSFLGYRAPSGYAEEAKYEIPRIYQPIEIYTVSDPIKWGKVTGGHGLMNDSISKIVELANSGRLKDAVALIHKMIDQGEPFEGAQVILAHLLLLASDWGYINRLLPPETNFFATSGYLNALGMGRPINAFDKPIPWFTYPAIDFLEGIVRKGWTVFEWGSGNSTLWWASRVKSVVAVEDDSSWFEEVTKQIPENAHVIKKSEADYYSAIADFPENEFNAIIVDGSHRNECVRFAVSHLKEDGILIFDNSDGEDYQESSIFLKELGYFKIDFWGLIPSYMYKNCTSVYFRNPQILKDYCPPSEHQSSVGISCLQAMAKHKS